MIQHCNSAAHKSVIVLYNVLHQLPCNSSSCIFISRSALFRERACNRLNQNGHPIIKRIMTWFQRNQVHASIRNDGPNNVQLSPIHEVPEAEVTSPPAPHAPPPPLLTPPTPPPPVPTPPPSQRSSLDILDLSVNPNRFKTL